MLSRDGREEADAGKILTDSMMRPYCYELIVQTLKALNKDG